jgi:hypothetical protein
MGGDQVSLLTAAAALETLGERYVDLTARNAALAVERRKQQPSKFRMG